MKFVRVMLYAALACVIAIADRLTKLWALKNLEVPDQVNEYLSYELVFNRGISWGMLGSENNAIFIAVSSIIVLVTAVLAVYAYKRAQQGHYIVGELCVIVGSCSNIIDRVVYGAVVDFIVLSYHSWSWPVFNVADMAVVFGVGVMMLAHWRE